MGAFFMFTVMNMLAKLLSENHSVIEIAFYRNLITSVPFLVMVFAFGKRDTMVIRSRPVWVVIRAIGGALSLVVTFTAFSMMPLADTTALLFTSSLFIPALGVLILKEKVGPCRWAAVVTGFAGVIIMSLPSSPYSITAVSYGPRFWAG